MLTFAQNSQKEASTAVDKNKVIGALLARVDAGEALIKTLEAREHALTEEIAKADAAHAALTDAHKAALLELGEVRATINYQKIIIADLKAQVELWRNESQRVTKELNSSRKRELILLAVIIARSLL